MQSNGAPLGSGSGGTGGDSGIGEPIHTAVVGKKKKCVYYTTQGQMSETSTKGFYQNTIIEAWKRNCRRKLFLRQFLKERGCLIKRPILYSFTNKTRNSNEILINFNSLLPFQKSEKYVKSKRSHRRHFVVSFRNLQYFWYVFDKEVQRRKNEGIIFFVFW